MQVGDAGPTSGGIAVVEPSGVIVLEFNEFLKRMACGVIRADTGIVGKILTGGYRKAASDLRLYSLVRSGQVATEDLPLRVTDGVLATGAEARAFLRAIERVRGPYLDARSDFGTLLRAVLTPVSHLFPAEMLRPSHRRQEVERPEDLPRPCLQRDKASK